MLSDITIGQYFPGKSLLHRMDPRVKLILTFIYIFAVFIPRNWVGLGIAVSFLFFSIILSRLPIKLILKSIKPILPIILITSILNIFYVKKGDPLFDWGFIHIKSQGLVTAAFIAIRIVCLIAGSSLLTYTTSPATLTDALERLLSPLKVVRLNVHELAMMMTIALRFIPTLIEETDKIISAQKARGADMESGGVMQRIRALIPVFIPLFVSSFRRAYELATAMECRCYRGGEGRTRMKQLRMQASDAICVFVVLMFVAALIILNFFLTPVF
ncbi:MAG: energy-coupling factor transporter transmembrane protein EcfT [Oscillospiraceae bacterium]|nr:energy-coupling factor transporter transmembrane protein EcfT [Oscillospiraceae bacterium]